MSWSFRLRGKLGNGSMFALEDSEWLLDEHPHHVRLVPLGEESLNKARELVVRGDSYASEMEARAEGERWRGIVARAFAEILLSCDFGDRVSQGRLTENGRARFAPQRVLDNVHGLMVFETEPPPAFFGFELGRISSSAPHEHLKTAVSTAKARGPLDVHRQTAYDLSSAASGLPHDAAFLLKMTAVEVLIQPAMRSAAAQDLIKELVQTTEFRRVELGDAVVDSLIGSLRHMKKESITQAGQRLARTLAPRTYWDLAPDAFFKKAYDVRSRLVHGTRPLPSFVEVARISSHLSFFLRDLIIL